MATYANGILERYDLRSYVRDRAGKFAPTSGGSVSAKDAYAISSYKNTGYYSVNEKLRQGKYDELSPSQKEMVKTLDDRIAESKTTEDMTVHRVIVGKRAGDKYLKEGTEVKDKAFMSTSNDETSAYRAVQDAGAGRNDTYTTVHIDVPKGTHAFDIQNAVTKNPFGVHSQGNEGELLFGRGTTVRIIRVDIDNREVWAEMLASIPPDLSMPASSTNLEYHRHILELANLWYYSDIRKTYWERTYNAIVEFLQGKSARTKFENDMKKAMVEAFVQTAEQAYEDAGADLPLDEDTLNYVGGVQSTELGYIGELFANLVLLRKEIGELAQFTAQDTAGSRADGYARTLDSVYANVKLLAKPNVMLTFAGSDGAESCTDCLGYKGLRRRAKWWVAKEAVPPSRHFECKGYKCQHHLVDDDGNLYTI